MKDPLKPALLSVNDETMVELSTIYFMTIAELNSNSKAAEKLLLGQPTLSAQPFGQSSSPNYYCKVF